MSCSARSHPKIGFGLIIDCACVDYEQGGKSVALEPMFGTIKSSIAMKKKRRRTNHEVLLVWGGGFCHRVGSDRVSLDERLKVCILVDQLNSVAQAQI